MKRVSIKALILGTLITVGIDTRAGMVMVATLGKSSLDPTVPIEQSIAAFIHRTDMLIFSLIIGTLSTMLAGYAAARIAKQAIYLNSGLLGIIGVIIGLFSAGMYPAWFNVLGFLTVIPAALLGGHLAKNKVAEG